MKGGEIFGWPILVIGVHQPFEELNYLTYGNNL